jgi:S-adenosylhomocysteine hydrolase
MPVSRELYNARTRKIIMYSDVIATGSNVLWVGGNMLAGNKRAVKQLDIGGLIVTIERLIHDTEYIRKIKEEFVVKEEFVFGNFNKMIQGDGLNLEETDVLY